jgi:hypothetical protein
VGSDSVIDGQLGARGNFPQGINFDPVEIYPEVTIGSATVIEMFEAVALRAVQGYATAEFDQIDLGMAFNHTPGEGQLDQRSADLAELSTWWQGPDGKNPKAIDSAGAHRESNGGGVLSQTMVDPTGRVEGRRLFIERRFGHGLATSVLVPGINQALLIRPFLTS